MVNTLTNKLKTTGVAKSDDELRTQAECIYAGLDANSTIVFKRDYIQRFDSCIKAVVAEGKESKNPELFWMTVWNYMVEHGAAIVGKYETQQAKKKSLQYYESMPIFNMELVNGACLVANEQCYGKGSAPKRDAI